MSKKIIFVTISIFCLLFSVYCLTVYAAKATEIQYPEINAIRPVSIKIALPKFARYAFDFLIAMSGLICLGSLTYGGIEYLTSTGDPGKQKSATSRIWSAFLGSALVLTSFIISQTINPQLVIPHIGIRAVGGLMLYSEHLCEEGGGEEKLIISDVPNFGEKEDGSEFIAKSLRFISAPGDLKALFYPEADYKGASWELSSDFQDCLQLQLWLPILGSFEAKSVKLFWQLPGIYLCTDIYEQDPLSNVWMCQGEEKYLGSSTALLEPDFNDKVKAIRLQPVYNTLDWAAGDKSQCTDDPPAGRAGKYWEKDGIGYCTFPVQVFEVVLHEHADFTGQCELFHATPTKYVFNLGSDSQTIGEDKASSVTVFAKPKITDILAIRGGGGVWLCEDVNPQRPYSTNGGVENPSKCHGRDSGDPTLGFQNISEDYIGDTHNDKISSIIIDGQYLAILFDGGDTDAFKGTCEVFTESDSNFRDNPIGRCGCLMGNWRCSDCLSSFIIISTAE